MRNYRYVLVAGVLAALAVGARIAGQKQSTPQVPPLRIEKQGSFFVGGHDIHSDTLSSTTTRSPSGTITVDQVYVSFQIPVDATGHPITFIHGADNACFLPESTVIHCNADSITMTLTSNTRSPVTARSSRSLKSLRPRSAVTGPFASCRA